MLLLGISFNRADVFFCCSEHLLHQYIGADNHIIPMHWCCKHSKSKEKCNNWCCVLTFIRLLLQLALFHQSFEAA
jgi:hypothetical protein